MKKKISLVLMALLYIQAGITHFTNPKFFDVIVPPPLPTRPVVHISGIIEILLGLALFVPGLRRWAAWGVMALLVAVYPANIYQALTPEAQMGQPLWVFLVRLPLQFVLLAWAYSHTKEPSA